MFMIPISQSESVPGAFSAVTNRDHLLPLGSDSQASDDGVHLPAHQKPVCCQRGHLDPRGWEDDERKSRMYQTCVKVYPGFILIRNGKTHRHRGDCHEEEVCAHRTLETGGMACHIGPHTRHFHLNDSHDPSIVSDPQSVDQTCPLA
ncbi:hypothetical protein H8959_002914 [Pygathrix nigripes]